MDHSKLTQIFSELVVSHHNMRMLHWNVKGHGFDKAHEKFDEYTSKLSTFIDEIAEIMLMIYEEPLDLVSAIKVVESSDNELIYIGAGSKYPVTSAYAICNNIFESLLKTYVDASLSDDLPSDIKSKLDEHTYFFRLELRYKGRSRGI